MWISITACNTNKMRLSKQQKNWHRKNIAVVVFILLYVNSAFTQMNLCENPWPPSKYLILIDQKLTSYYKTKNVGQKEDMLEHINVYFCEVAFHFESVAVYNSTFTGDLHFSIYHFVTFISLYKLSTSVIECTENRS